MRGPFWECRVSDLRWHGDLDEACAAGLRALELFATDDDWTRAPRLAAFTIEAIADAVGSGVAHPGWIDSAKTWHVHFAQATGPMIFGEGDRSTATADLSRAEGDNDPDLWRIAVESWGDQAYDGAKARWRLAQALAEANPTDSEITELLDHAQQVAERLKARPLLKAVGITRGITVL